MVQTTLPPSASVNSHPTCSLNRLHQLSQPTVEPNYWVKLVAPLNPYCHDEALLLCQASDSEGNWIAWVPDHGEAILHVSQFV